MHCETLPRLSIKEMNLKHWGVTVDPPSIMEKILVGRWHSELEGRISPLTSPPVIPTLGSTHTC